MVGRQEQLPYLLGYRRLTGTYRRLAEPFAAFDGRVINEHGEVHVLIHVSGFKKIKFYTSENVGYGDITLPDNEMITTSYWLTIEHDIFLQSYFV